MGGRENAQKLRRRRRNAGEFITRKDDRVSIRTGLLKQVKAVQGALSKINDSVLRAHIRDHVVTAAQRGDADHIVQELMEALKYKA